MVTRPAQVDGIFERIGERRGGRLGNGAAGAAASVRRAGRNQRRRRMCAWRGMAGGMVLLVLLAAMVVFAAGICLLLGKFMCAAVPKRIGLPGLIHISMGALGLAMVLIVGYGVLRVIARGRRFPPRWS